MAAVNRALEKVKYFICPVINYDGDGLNSVIGSSPFIAAEIRAAVICCGPLPPSASPAAAAAPPPELASGKWKLLFYFPPPGRESPAPELSALAPTRATREPTRARPQQDQPRRSSLCPDEFRKFPRLRGP